MNNTVRLGVFSLVLGGALSAISPSAEARSPKDKSRLEYSPPVPPLPGADFEKRLKQNDETQSDGFTPIAAETLAEPCSDFPGIEPRSIAGCMSVTGVCLASMAGPGSPGTCCCELPGGGYCPAGTTSRADANCDSNIACVGAFFDPDGDGCGVCGPVNCSLCPNDPLCRDEKPGPESGDASPEPGDPDDPEGEETDPTEPLGGPEPAFPPSGPVMDCTPQVSGGLSMMVGESGSITASIECQEAAGEREREDTQVDSFFDRWLGIQTAYAAKGDFSLQYDEQMALLGNSNSIEGFSPSGSISSSSDCSVEGFHVWDVSFPPEISYAPNDMELSVTCLEPENPVPGASVSGTASMRCGSKKTRSVTVTCRVPDALPVCGNSKLEGEEACDDGNDNELDGCTTLCQIGAICGNGTLEGGELCDDGNDSSGDGCDAGCQLEVCGDGVMQGNEECDDGGTKPNDGCSSQCKTEKCGDGIKQKTEECDDGGTDDGDGCNSQCETEGCGDGILQPGLGEVCDDGNKDNQDECTNKCKSNIVCGNGTPQTGEQCDDGNATNCDACNNDCTLPPVKVCLGQELCSDQTGDEGSYCPSNAVYTLQGSQCVATASSTCVCGAKLGTGVDCPPEIIG